MNNAAPLPSNRIALPSTAPFTFIDDADPAALPLKAAVANAGAELRWYIAGNTPIPMTFGKGAGLHCYITSPVSAYMRYPAAELTERRPFVSRLLKTFAHLSRASGIEQGITVGNLPLSTNLYAEQPSDLLDALKSCLIHDKDNWLFVRNLRRDRHSGIIAEMEMAGLTLLPARVVYEFRETVDGKLPRASHLKRDISLLRKSFSVVPHAAFGSMALAACEYMYNSVYIDRHSGLNPRYSTAFMHQASATGALEFTGLADADGSLVAFAAIHSAHGVMTVPMLGYDTARPKEVGAYRALVAHLINLAANRRHLFNFSSGAGDAKRKRGAIPCLEYSACRPAGPEWRAALLRKIGRQIEARVSLKYLMASGA